MYEHYLCLSSFLLKIWDVSQPKLLSIDQKENQVSAVQDLLENITGDKLWVYGYDPETKAICSGRRQLLWDQRVHNRVEAMWKNWWVFFDY